MAAAGQAYNMARAATGIRLHQMHDMRTMAIDVAGICLSVSLSIKLLGCANTAKWINMLFGVKSPPGDAKTLY